MRGDATGRSQSRNPYGRLLLALATAVLAASLFVLALTAPSWGVADLPGEWQTLAPSGMDRQEVSYTVVGGKFYLAGGTTNKFGMTLHERYDPVADSWSQVAPLPKGLTHIQAVELGGKIYYVGGMEGSPNGPHGPSSDTVFVYDPATDSFSEGAPMMSGRERGAAGTAVYDGKIYIAGGQHDAPDGVYNPTSKPWFDVYNPVTEAWVQLPDMPRARDHFHAAVVDGKFYAIGGRQTRDVNIVTAVDVYDLSQGSGGTWQTLDTALPTPRSGFATAVLGREILVIGGEGNGIAYNTVEAYDTATNSWRELQPMPTARHGIQAAVYNGGVYVAAGANDQGASPTNVHEAFLDTSPTIAPRKPKGKITDRTPKIVAVVRDDQSGGLAEGDIELFVDGQPRDFSYAPATGQLTHASKRLPYGRHTVEIVATDGAHNVAQESWSFKVVKKRR
jgi:N-acetylneuraminic acid mutarotase